MKKEIAKSLNIWKEFIVCQLRNKEKNFSNDLSRKIYLDLKSKGYSKINIFELSDDYNLDIKELKEFYKLTKKNFEKFYEDGHKKNNLINQNSRKSDYQIRMAGTKFYNEFENDLKKISKIKIMREVIENFIGIDFKHFQSDYWITIKNKNSPLRQASQRWHSDPEYFKILKIFIYLDDVAVDNGPTEYIPNSFLSVNFKQFFLRLYNFPHISSYYPEWLVNLLFSKKKKFVSEGKRGDIFFYNTTGLHRGGYVNKGERKLTIFSFTSKKSPYLKDIYI